MQRKYISIFVVAKTALLKQKIIMTKIYICCQGNFFMCLYVINFIILLKFNTFWHACMWIKLLLLTEWKCNFNPYTAQKKNNFPPFNLVKLQFDLLTFDLLYQYVNFGEIFYSDFIITIVKHYILAILLIFKTVPVLTLRGPCSFINIISFPR